MLAQSGAYGMEKTVDPAHEIGESLTITERSQLLSITPEQRKKIKSLRIENQIFKENLTLTFAFQVMTWNRFILIVVLFKERAYGH